MVLPKRKRSAAVRPKAPKKREFMAAWLRAPLSMGAIVPSSGRLARAMAAQVDKQHRGIVIELGAGTGPVTDALLEAGISPKRLLVLEREARLCAVLTAQFPSLQIICEDAVNLRALWESLGEPDICAIVSSLPMVSLPAKVKHSVQAQMAELAAAHSAPIIQFTYAAKSPLDRRELRRFHLVGKRVKTILTNVPPAHVWVYKV
jgi:phosphatidylethanolamine/phosphatidyl-N-methylethanolamine N-methyltransferase